MDSKIEREFVFLIEREGEGGRIGKIRSAMMLPTGDNRIYNATHGKGRYYIGSRKEYEEFHKRMALDFNKDGVVDARDLPFIRRWLAYWRGQR